MLFNEKKNARPQYLTAQEQRNPGVRMQRDPTMHSINGYGIPPGVAARVAAMGAYGIPPGVAARIASASGGFGIPPGVAARVAAMGGYGAPLMAQQHPLLTNMVPTPVQPWAYTVPIAPVQQSLPDYDAQAAARSAAVVRGLFVLGYLNSPNYKSTAPQTQAAFMRYAAYRRDKTGQLQTEQQLIRELAAAAGGFSYGDYGIPPAVAARVAAMGDYGQIDEQGNWIVGTDPTNMSTNPDGYSVGVPGTNYVSNDPSAPYVDAGSGGVVVPPPNAGGSGGASGVDWTKLFVSGEQLATGIIAAVVAGTKPAAGTSCPAGYQFVAQTGTCMTPTAYAAWLQTSKGGGMSTTVMVVGGIALLGLAALVLNKRRGGGAMAGYSRRRRRSRR